MHDPSTSAPQCQPPLQPHELGGWSPVLALADLPRPLDLEAMFGRRAPVELEVGFGSGVFIADESRAHPERDYLGVEKELSQVRRTAEKIRRRGNLNARLVHCDAFYFLEEFPPRAAFDAVRIYFSDPWPKTRHHKRRVFQPRLLPILERVLRPGGMLHVKTDVTEYYTLIRKLLAEAPFLEVAREQRLDLEPLEGDRVTNYQRKAVAKGHPVHLLELRHRG
jgi:tRNA (guanine-N7-)-methyltransferase